MSRANTFDTVIFTWHDARRGIQRRFDTAEWDGLVIKDIKGVDDWTISRDWISDPETARQIEISYAWEAVAFEIEGVIVDDTKTTDKELAAWAETKETIRMQVVGFEDLGRDFKIAAFSLARYGNVRPFTISCVDVAGHIRSARTKRIDLNTRDRGFRFPFSNRVGTKFSFGSSRFLPSVPVHSNSFIAEEPFRFTCVFSALVTGFMISNDRGQALRIDTDFQSGDVLTIDMINSVFRLTRADIQIPILKYIDYANASFFGIRQGDQTINIHEAPVSSAQIVFTEHLA